MAFGWTTAAFGQGQIIFENASSSGNNYVTLNSPNGPKTGSGLVVELLWYNGSSFVREDTFTSTFTGAGQNGQDPGRFVAGELTIPQAGDETFIVEGFYTSGGVIYSGTTIAFTAPVTVSPAPVGHTDTGGSWTTTLGEVPGEMVLSVPEPSTIVLGDLGVAVLLLFRRRK